MLTKIGFEMDEDFINKFMNAWKINAYKIETQYFILK